MKHQPIRLSAVQIALGATFIALASTFPSPALANEPFALKSAVAQETVGGENGREARKAKIRLEAEKNRLVREALEKRQAAAARLPGMEDNDGSTEVSASIGHAFATQARDVRKNAISVGAASAIEKIVRNLSLNPQSAALAAGFLRGISGPTVYERLLAAEPQRARPAVGLYSEVADADYPILEQRYSVAQRAGQLLQYALLISLAAGIGIFGFNSLTSLSSRPRKRSAPYEKKGTNQWSINLKLLKLFSREKSTQALSGNATLQPIVMPYDLEVLKDYAVNLLFARGRHDLTGCRDMVTPNLSNILETYFKTCEARGHWNRVDRISNLDCAEMETWMEGDTSYAKLLVQWRAVDYVINFNRRADEKGYIVEGSPAALESFAEEWTVIRKVGEAWVVDAMCPVRASKTV